uniref:Uncharacterized protein n=1 Tax=uncultured marine virus TaxID=186617 RepID=A0A0F7L2T6_9VIRU|nr:hypothetical protein [uncultured marine virus]
MFSNVSHYRPFNFSLWASVLLNSLTKMTPPFILTVRSVAFLISFATFSLTTFKMCGEGVGLRNTCVTPCSFVVAINALGSLPRLPIFTPLPFLIFPQGRPFTYLPESFAPRTIQGMSRW